MKYLLIYRDSSDVVHYEVYRSFTRAHLNLGLSFYKYDNGKLLFSDDNSDDGCYCFTQLLNTL